MVFHYVGKYETEKDLKSKREPDSESVAFKEPSENAFALMSNLGSFLLVIVLGFVVYILAHPSFKNDSTQLYLGFIVPMFTLVPHEFLHALCFKGDVYMYTNFSKMLAFVHGTEDMSKARFVFMSMLPNIVFGFIPYIVFLINNEFVFLGIMGAMCIGMGFGDYINVFNALTQMPKGAKTFLSGFHSYWYLDENSTDK